MTEKLLSKPPFRFLHDIVTNCNKATGFPAVELFEEDLRDAKSITETKHKLRYLDQAIGYIAMAIGDPSLADTVKAKKIAAGLEPEQTNILLQALAEGCASGIDADAVLKKFEAGGAGAAEEEEEAPKAKAPEKKAERPRKEEPEAETRGGGGAAPIKGMAMPKLALGELKDKDKDEEKNPYSAKLDAESGGGGTFEAPAAPAKLGRPRTARRAPPKLPSNLVAEGEGKDGDGPMAGGVIMDGMAEPEEEEEEEEEEAEQLKGFNNDDEEEEGDGQHGKLVSDILKAQGKGKQEEEKDPKFGFARLPSARKAQNNSLYNSKNIQELRQKIQKICQSVNPLVHSRRPIIFSLSLVSPATLALLLISSSLSSQLSSQLSPPPPSPFSAGQDHRLRVRGYGYHEQRAHQVAPRVPNVPSKTFQHTQHHTALHSTATSSHDQERQGALHDVKHVPLHVPLCSGTWRSSMTSRASPPHRYAHNKRPTH
jgi:TRAF3-interacting protein 1